MSPTARTDSHRSTEIVPSDYVLLGLFYQGGSDDEMIGYRIDNRRHSDFVQTVADRNQQVFRGNHHDKGSCDICGTHFAHGAYWLHTPTGDVIHTGQQCADKLDMAAGSDMADQRGAIKAKVADAKKKAELAAAHKAFLDQHPGLAEALAYDHSFIKQIAGKFRQWGNLSPRQIEVVIKIHTEELAKAAAPAEPDVPAAPEPEPVAAREGRYEITGTVTGVKVREGDWGWYTRITVKTDEGFRVNGNVPSDAEGNKLNLEDGSWGQRIRFTATVTRSEDDETMGWFKVGKRAEILAEAPAAV